MAVITISRQIGSGGDEIGQMVARELGMAYLDKEIVRLTAERIGLRAAAADPEQQHRLVQRLVPLLLLGEAESTDGDQLTSDATPGAMIAHTTYQQMLAEVIREIARRGHAVIMGRGSQAILQAVPGVLHVHISAPLPVRVERVAHQYALDPAEAEQLVQANDRERAAYLRAEYGVDWQSPALYDLMITTGRLPMQAAAAAIVAVARVVEAAERGETRYHRVRQDHYSVKEAAEVLLMPAEVIRHAVYAGDLPATRAGKAIVSISRQDLLRWLAREPAATHA